MKTIRVGFEFVDEANGCLCRITGQNGSGLAYIDEFEYNEDDQDYTIASGERMLTFSEIKNIIGESVEWED